MQSKTRKNVIVIGGGTGTYTVLTGLKKYDLNLTSVVSMMDSGGSSGRLRDEFGILPPGDVRQSLVALSNDTSTLRKLFIYRFEKGNGLVGHNFGNLFLTALADIHQGMGEAIESASKILGIKGQVLPVTTDHANLVAEYTNGEIIKGEHFIDEPSVEKQLRIKRVWLEPEAKIYPKVQKALVATDLIILGPGDLYTSIIPNLLVDGVSETIRSSKARVIYIVNLMSKLGQTRGFSAADCVSEVNKYLGKKVDIVLMNSAALPDDILKKYQAENDFPIKDDLDGNYTVVREDFLATNEIKTAKSDLLKRSLIRHDSNKLASAVIDILK